MGNCERHLAGKGKAGTEEGGIFLGKALQQCVSAAGDIPLGLHGWLASELDQTDMEWWRR